MYFFTCTPQVSSSTGGGTSWTLKLFQAEDWDELNCWKERLWGEFLREDTARPPS